MSDGIRFCGSPLSGQVSPVFSANNAMHGRVGESVLLNNLFLSDLASVKASTNFDYVCICHSGAFDSNTPGVPVFGTTIGHIVALTAEEEVGGIDTERIVAAMQYELTSRDLSVGQFP